MENYTKGKNVEEPLERDKIPIPNLPENFLWMQVRGGSKMRNLLSHALNEFPEAKSVVWTGFGPSVGKAISCAEIMKHQCKENLHQITKICYRVVKEYWDPKIPELDQLVVKRKLPMIHILLSASPLNANELGYQGPLMTQPLHSNESNQATQRSRSNQEQYSTAAMEAGNKKRSKRSKLTNKKKSGGRNPPTANQSDQTSSTDA